MNYESRLPVFLRPNNAINAILYDGAGFTTKNSHLAQSLTNRDSKIATSVNKLLHQISGEELNEKIASHLKRGEKLPEGQFVLTPCLEREGEKSELGNFYQDGDYGLVLGIKYDSKSDPFWLAGTSFRSFRKQIKRYGIPPLKEAYEDGLSLLDAPIIIQLQGCAYYPNTKKSKLVGKTLAVFNWEAVLASIVIDWAASEKFSAIYLLPARNNQYYFYPVNWHKPIKWQQNSEKAEKTVLERRNSFINHYDKTAEGLGFLPVGRDLIYMLALTYPKSINSKQVVTQEEIEQFG